MQQAMVWKSKKNPKTFMLENVPEEPKKPNFTKHQGLSSDCPNVGCSSQKVKQYETNRKQLNKSGRVEEKNKKNKKKAENEDEHEQSKKQLWYRVIIIVHCLIGLTKNVSFVS